MVERRPRIESKDLQGRPDLCFGFLPNFLDFTEETRDARESGDVGRLVELTHNEQGRDQMILTKGPKAIFLREILQIGGIFAGEVRGTGIAQIQNSEM